MTDGGPKRAPVCMTERSLRDATIRRKMEVSYGRHIHDTGDRRYSGYALAQLLGWPVVEMTFRERFSGVLSSLVGRIFCIFCIDELIGIGPLP